MDDVKLRAWWFHRQGLDGSVSEGSLATVLEKTGWMRSVGGAGPYIGFHARCGAGREAIDGAVADLQILELPSARGCTYVVPDSAYALALKLSQASGTEAEMRTARKLGVTDAEIDQLCLAVLDALKKSPLGPDELRGAVGDATRSLGEEGKKKGLSTTIPLALGRLQESGEIRRVSTNGRLDQQKYRYALWVPNPLDGFGMSHEEANLELARLYFSWIGPATVAEFQWFSGLGLKAAKAAIEPLGLSAFGDRWIPAELLEEFSSFAVSREPRYALVSGLDGVVLLRRDVKGLLDAADYDRAVAGDKGSKPAASLSDLPSHGIFDRGRLIGLWEYDPEAQEIVWNTYVKPDDELHAAVRRMEEFVRGDLGDARSFSLDSPKSRAPRLRALRALQV